MSDWNNARVQEKKSIEERFWEKVDIRDKDECWNWLATKYPSGYGSFRFNGIMIGAHRVAWELIHGEIPDGGDYRGMCVCHRCDNRLCCNPSHLFLGTHQDNMNDRDKKGRGFDRSGVKNGRSKLTKKQVLDIRELYKSGEYSCKTLGDMFGVGSSTIHRAITKKAWKHI